MPFKSGELKRLYELLIDVGHPISASRAGALFRADELAQYVEDVIDSIVPAVCVLGETECQEYRLFECQEVLGKAAWVFIKDNAEECGYVPPLPPVCTLGETRCVEFDLYECQEVEDEATWVLKESNAEICGYVPPPPPPDVKEEGIRLYQARLSAFTTWRQLEQAPEDARNYLFAVHKDWRHAVDQEDHFVYLRGIWRKAEDAYWHNKGVIDRLQRDARELEAQMNDLYRELSDLTQQWRDLRKEIADYQYEIEMWEDNLAYWERKEDDAEDAYWHCRSYSPDPRVECKPLWYEWLEARELLELAQEHLEDALETLTYLLQEKWLVDRRIRDAWAEYDGLQRQLRDIQSQIRNLMGVLGDIKEILIKVSQYEELVNYWSKEKWRLKDEVAAAQIRLSMAQIRYNAAEEEWDNARRAWGRFKDEHPAIAQEILDEWGS